MLWSHRSVWLLVFQGLLFSVTFGAEAQTIPDPNRVAQIAQWLPEEAHGVGAPIADRAAWESLAVHPAWKGVVRRAEESLREEIPQLTDELYLDFSRTGNRDHYQTPYGRIQSRLKYDVLAECLENQGRFLPDAEKIIQYLCSIPSWTMPAHDRSLAAFRGEEYNIDLGASTLGWLLATSDYLLGEKLTDQTQQMMREHLDKRILTPIRQQINGELPRHWWFTTTNNWNAVCLANVTGTALAVVSGREERAFYVAAAEYYIRNFLKGFTADGYCSEGLGYWNYGYGRFLLLTETVYQATDGQLDLLDNPAAQIPARFGWDIQLAPGISPAFADCSINARADAHILYYLSRRLGLAMCDPGYDPISSGGTLVECLLYSFPNTASNMKTSGPIQALPVRTWFDKAGILIARPVGHAECRMAVAIKGGHNNEHHNHNDVGSYVVTVDGKLLLADPGSEVYTARTFSNRRYESDALNSFGHAVPIVAGELQRVGADARARFLKTEFAEERDTVVMDITSAYDVNDLEQLSRTFVYSRTEPGRLTIVDEVVYTQPQSFETALITFGQVQIMDDDTLRITERDVSLVIKIDTQDRAFTLIQQTIDENFRARKQPARIGIRLNAPIKNAKVLLDMQAASFSR